MLTYEKVLDVFRDYLAEDAMFEIVMTHNGYIMLEWDERTKECLEAHTCRTPEAMLDELLGAYGNYVEFGLTHGQRELTTADEAEIRRKQQAMADKCK